MQGLSVIVCCYNSALRIPKTLEHLARQQIQGFAWEVIIVDNNCTDETVQVAMQYGATYPQLSLQIVKEPQAGLSYAREKGVASASYDLLLFCDDDNWLEPHYLHHAFELLAQHSQVAILGGQIFPVFETQEPEWFKAYAGGYAVGQTTSQALDKRSWAYGAGMVVRKSIWEEIKQKGFRNHLSDRKGAALSSGGDSELCYQVQLLNKEVAVTSLLQMHHFIPKGRLTLAYALGLYKGFGISLPILDMYESVLKKGGNTTYYEFLISRLKHYTSLLSPMRMLFYRTLRPAHPYLVLPHVIMSKNALLGLLSGVKKNAAIYNEITKNYKNV